MDPFTWLLIGTAVKTGLDLFGQSKQKRAQEELAEVNAESAKLQGAETIRRLELERGNTLSTLTARAGRAGAEVASTGAITPSTHETTERVKIEMPAVYGTAGDRTAPLPRYKTVTTPGKAASFDVSGAGGSVLIQQQRIADLYEQEILYTRKQTALAEQGADIQGDFMRESANLDMIGTIIESGTDMFKMNYAYNQYKVPDADLDYWNRMMGPR